MEYFSLLTVLTVLRFPAFEQRHYMTTERQWCWRLWL